MALETHRPGLRRKISGWRVSVRGMKVILQPADRWPRARRSASGHSLPNLDGSTVCIFLSHYAPNPDITNKPRLPSTHRGQLGAFSPHGEWNIFDARRQHTVL